MTEGPRWRLVCSLLTLFVASVIACNSARAAPFDDITSAVRDYPQTFSFSVDNDIWPALTLRNNTALLFPDNLLAVPVDATTSGKSSMLILPSADTRQAKVFVVFLRQLESAVQAGKPQNACSSNDDDCCELNPTLRCFATYQGGAGLSLWGLKGGNVAITGLDLLAQELASNTIWLDISGLTNHAHAFPSDKLLFVWTVTANKRALVTDLSADLIDRALTTLSIGMRRLRRELGDPNPDLAGYMCGSVDEVSRVRPPEISSSFLVSTGHTSNVRTSSGASFSGSVNIGVDSSHMWMEFLPQTAPPIQGANSPWRTFANTLGASHAPLLTCLTPDAASGLISHWNLLNGPNASVIFFDMLFLRAAWMDILKNGAL